MEGPLVSDTTELLSGAPSASEDAPVGNSAPPAAAGGATAPTSKSRSRGGTGLSSLLLPELQRMAQSMGIQGAGRMRKGQLVEAIQARQGGAGIANQGSDQRVASAGADSTRLRKQDAMEPATHTQPGIGDGAAAGIGGSARGQGAGIGADGAGEQLSFDQSAAAGRTAGRAQRTRTQRPRLSRPRPSRPRLSRPQRSRLRPSRPEPRSPVARRRAAARTPSRVRGTRPRAATRSVVTGGAGTGAATTSPRVAVTRPATVPAATVPAATAAIRTVARTAAARTGADATRPGPRRPGPRRPGPRRPGPGADGGQPRQLGRGVRRRQARWP